MPELFRGTGERPPVDAARDRRGSLGPGVWGVPPGADFPEAVAAALIAAGRGRPPEDLARVRILVNSGRMRRRLRERFGARRPLLLPRIGLVGESPGGEPAGTLRSRLELARLVAALIEREPGLAPRTAAFDLAETLMRLADEMQVEGVGAEALERLDPGPHAAHWQRSLAFLRILAPLLADPSNSAGGRLRAAIRARIDAWTRDPPATPVIVAGSTGSRGAILDLMAAVKALPQGLLILPGYDADLPEAVWRRLMAAGAEAEDHPQYRFARLMVRLGIGPGDVRPLPGALAPCPARGRLVSLALRPAPVTHQWREEGARLADLDDATGRVALIEAPSPRIEAVAIALRLRRAVEDGTVAALVTPDRALGRRVAAALDRWGIEPDDSAGRPLGLTAPGRLLRQTAELFGQRLTGDALLALLKHPLVASGANRGEHLRRTRGLELRLRARGPAFPEAGSFRGEDDPWSDWIAATLFVDLPAEATLAQRVAGHLALVEALAAGPGGPDAGALWEAEPGRRARQAMEELRAAADTYGATSPAEYAALLTAHLTGEVREASGPRPDVMILGTLEARVGGAGLVVLGGLNEGTWPAVPPPDPWLNRRLRAEAGLLLPERQVGLSAHDFQQAVAAPEVVLARSVRDAEAETVPSRWLNRLTNLLAGLPTVGGPDALAAMHDRGAAWVAAAEALDRAPPVRAARRPSPRPPVAARPRALSVTQITTLIRDPYAVYARSVLGLRPLRPLRAEPDPLLRGKVLHLVMERFAATPPEDDPRAAAARLMRLAEATLAEEVAWPVARRLWLGRLRRAAAWLVAEERRRRDAGTPVLTEERQRWTVPGIEFTLVGQPDRVERLTAGGYAVVDYKSGPIPTKKEMTHFDRQLLLGAAMVEGGAFPEVPPAPVAEVAYIPIGGAAGARSYRLPFRDRDVHFDVPGTLDGLRRMIADYDRRATGYTARRAPARSEWRGDYDHLARFGEWEDSDDAVPEEVG
jgi:inactivated superfamily I helicase/RecB family exonuclease